MAIDRYYWTGYDRLHFAARTLLENMDTAALRERNTFWPAGTTLDWIEQRLAALLDELKDQIVLPPKGSCGVGFITYDVCLPEGFLVRIGIDSNGRISLFQPLSGKNILRMSWQDIQKLYTRLKSE
ncbi:MAG: hypothetical protein RMM17_08450 [Acidobacteriota bacterium]|nr:hypothetical protein [Blastocatellia bacterium]MDW8412697.1 hypothetical protein [Acidobacteriota bacterium]